MRSLVLCALLASVAAIATPISAGNFSLSCTEVNLTNHYFLNATCTTPDNGNADAQSQNRLDLAMCIGIDYISGGLQWEVYGKFTNYCHNCTMLAPQGDGDNHRLVCYCLPVAGIQRCVKTTLNLDEGIANDNGTLKCAGGMASLIHGPDEELGYDE